jgi:hypothetical protein
MRSASTFVIYIQNVRKMLGEYWEVSSPRKNKGENVNLNVCQQTSIFVSTARGSVLAFGTQVRGFAPGRSRRIFRSKKSSTRLPSEGK